MYTECIHTAAPIIPGDIGYLNAAKYVRIKAINAAKYDRIKAISTCFEIALILSYLAALR